MWVFLLPFGVIIAVLALGIWIRSTDHCNNCGAVKGSCSCGVGACEAPSTIEARITALLVAHRDMIEAQASNDGPAEVTAAARLQELRAAIAGGKEVGNAK